MKDIFAFLVQMGLSSVGLVSTLDIFPKRERHAAQYLIGLYVYGAVAYLLIGVAAIAWKDRAAFAIIIMACSATAIGYRIRFLTEMDTVALLAMTVLSWLLPLTAAFILVS